MCEYENQTLEAFVADSRLFAKFDCPVARQNFSLLQMTVELANNRIQHVLILSYMH